MYRFKTSKRNTGIVIRDVAADPTRVWTVDALIEAAFTLPVAPAGTSGYSTTNTLIIGKILEKVTGQTIEARIGEVAARAGLTASALDPAGDETMPEPATHGYIEKPGVDALKEVGAEVVAGTDVTDWTVSWGGAGGGMYATIEDLGRWAATGLGTSLLPADLGARRLVAEPGAAGRYGLGIQDWGSGWIAHTGQIIGWEAVVAYNTRTGAAFVAGVNETGSSGTALSIGAQVFPELVQGMLGG